MIKLNKKVLLHLILISGCISYYSYLQFDEVKEVREEIKTELQSHNSLFTDAVNSKFQTMELFLDVLGSHILIDDAYSNPEKIEQLITNAVDRMKDTNKALLGLHFADTTGQVIATSSLLSPIKSMNLLKMQETQGDFKRALTARTMILSKVYHNKYLDIWVLPLRKALRDSSGKVVGVLTTGIMIHKGVEFVKNITEYPQQVSLLLNDVGLWRIYATNITPDNYKTFYLKPLEEEVYLNGVKQGLNENISSIAELKEKEIPFFAENKSTYIGENTLSHAVYNKRYQFWSITMVPTKTIKTVLVEQGFFSKCFSALLAISIILVLLHVLGKREKDKKDALRHQATHDPLTNLNNRYALQNTFPEWSSDPKTPFYLYFIDCDNFKNANDSFGHASGDLILQIMAERLSLLAPNGSILFRLGGDEFAFLVKSEELTSSASFAKNILQQLSLPYEVHGMHIHITASVGIARFPEDAQSLEGLMIAADLAVHNAKIKRNFFAHYCHDLKEAMMEKNEIGQNLRHGLERNEFYIAFQPQVRHDGKIHGVEALVRWQSLTLGFVPPDKFISIAEDLGIMPELGLYIIDSALADFSKIQDDCFESCGYIHLSLNISVKQLTHRKFKEKLFEQLNHHQIDSRYVTLEITESLLMENLDNVLPILEEFRLRGIQISLDDFGTGYSSLSMLKELPIDELKIDRSFIANIDTEQDKAAITNSIIDMSHALQLNVVAEGVEDTIHHKMLEKHGCDIYQGYYFSKPLSPKETEDFIKQFKSFNLS